MSLGLESKVGALRTLGEEFPDEKLEEIRAELMSDAKADGALKLVQTQIENEIADLTGMLSGGIGGQPTPINPAMGGNMSNAPGGAPGAPAPMMPPVLDEAAMQSQMAEQQLRTELVVRAYGTTLPNRRVPTDYEK
jgi:hypothetical protein